MKFFIINSRLDDIMRKTNDKENAQDMLDSIRFELPEWMNDIHIYQKLEEE